MKKCRCHFHKRINTIAKKGVHYSAMVQSLNFESEINDEDIVAFVKIIFSDIPNEPNFSEKNIKKLLTETQKRVILI